MDTPHGNLALVPPSDEADAHPLELTPAIVAWIQKYVYGIVEDGEVTLIIRNSNFYMIKPSQLIRFPDDLKVKRLSRSQRQRTGTQALKQA